jgi:hypothetical protein
LGQFGDKQRSALGRQVLGNLDADREIKPPRKGDRLIESNDTEIRGRNFQYRLVDPRTVKPQNIVDSSGAGGCQPAPVPASDIDNAGDLNNIEQKRQDAPRRCLGRRVEEAVERVAVRRLGRAQSALRRAIGGQFSP